MKFDVFIHRLIKLKNKSLPGVQSHLELAPKNRIQLLKKHKSNLKTHDAAVSLCFFPDLNNDVILPLILRNEYDGVHSNQVSLPGGKKEYYDSDLIDTSKRETFEEIGIIKENMNFQFKLTDIYIPPSNFFVRPYIFTIDNTPLLNPNRHEVVKVIKPKLTSLMNLNIQYGFINEKKMESPFFLIENHIVWGATAMILNEFLSLFNQ